MEAVVERADVNLDDVALLQLDLRGRDPMDHLIVQRNASASRESVKPQKAGLSPCLHNELVQHMVDFLRGNARLHIAFHRPQRRIGKLARLADCLNFLCIFENDHSMPPEPSLSGRWCPAPLPDPVLDKVYFAFRSIPSAARSGYDKPEAAPKPYPVHRLCGGWSAALIAYALGLRGLIFDMIGCAAAPADSSAGHPADNLRIADFNINDLINGDPHLIQRHRLSQCTRKTV